MKEGKVHPNNGNPVAGRTFRVTGMSCAACVGRVERAVNAVPGVEGCEASLLTGRMRVRGTADASAVAKAVEAAGYGAEDVGVSERAPSRGSDEKTARVFPWRLTASVGLLAALMGLSMVAMKRPGWLPGWLFVGGVPNWAGIALLELLLAGAALVLNQGFFRRGVGGVLRGGANMDTLVALGAGASFAWSVAALFLMLRAQAAGGAGAARPWMGRLYFESAAMIVTLISVGKFLEARAKGRTTSALASLARIRPRTARVLRDGAEREVPAESVVAGDLFAVRPGEAFPADGIVEEGVSAADESSLTGESMPVDKAPGDAVSAGTLNRGGGFLRCRATRVGEDTALAQIVRLMEDAALTKAPVAKMADRVAAVFVPSVLALALVAFGAWLAAGAEPWVALARGIAVLVVSCPCALGLATPVAIMVGSGVGARRGILFKTAAALEAAGRVRTVVFDKTGTLTAGEPRLAECHPAGGVSAAELLACAARLEIGSGHPLARAVVRGAEERGVAVDGLAGVRDFEALPGCGVRGELDGEAAFGGSLAFAEASVSLPSDAKRAADAAADDGMTPLFFVRGGRLLGWLAVADSPKPDAAPAVAALRAAGLRVAMLTGDNERTARRIAREVGIDEVHAGVLPDGKHRVVEELKQYGSVAMVGDGVNDAPALAVADVALAIGAGTDVAVDAADVVLMHGRLLDAVHALRIGRATLRNIRQNLFWAFFYNVLLIPLAAGAWRPLFGWTMNPGWAALAMSLSSLCVVGNALRLNFLRPEPSPPTAAASGIPPIPSQESPMKKILRVEGMMCPHCEARVKKALEAISGVSGAIPSHVEGSVAVELSGPVSDDAFRAAVEGAGYVLSGIE